ncbi:MAG: putative bifunctional diguanylate cyclase/phosphodiesterase [Holosporales bacterium]
MDRIDAKDALHPLLYQQYQQSCKGGQLDTELLIRLVDATYAQLCANLTVSHPASSCPLNGFLEKSPGSTTEDSARVNDHERYELIAHASGEGFWDWNVETGEIWASARMREMLGFPALQELKADYLLSRIHPADLEIVNNAFRSYLQKSSENFWCEFRVLHRRGHYIWLLVRAAAKFNSNGQALRVAGTLVDLTEQKIQQQRLAHDAVFDAITALPNRRLFLDRLHQERLRGTKYTLFFLDIDGFKQINDTLGHENGNTLLRLFAERVLGRIRSEDTMARLAGDEFAILLPRMWERDAVESLALRILDALKEPIVIADHELSVTASVGILVTLDQPSDPEQLLSDAALAMHSAKKRGIGCIEFFDASMRVQSLQRLTLERGLKHAIERGEMDILYQPIVELKSHKIAGFEALLRWNHPDFGTLSPVDFIPLAEETRLISDLGQWVLEKSCQQIKQWHHLCGETPPYMSVNVSAFQLEQLDFVQCVEGALENSGLAARHLLLEVTESTLIGNLDRVTALFNRIRSRGIGIAIDDFGTGYSSLRYLSQLPFSSLKVDQSFIARLHESQTDQNLTRVIIRLAKLLGLSVIAEGIELPQQLSQLVALEADYGQGYLFSKPLSAQAIEAILHSGRCLEIKSSSG